MRTTFKERLRSALPVFAVWLGLIIGLLDAVRVQVQAPHLFHGLMDRTAFLVFAVGFYLLLGTVVGILVALLPLSWFRMRAPTVGEKLGSAYLALLVSLALAAYILVENVDFFYFRLELLKNTAVLLAVGLGVFWLPGVLFRLFHQWPGLDRALGWGARLAGSKIFLVAALVLFALAAVRVLRVPLSVAEAGGAGRPNVILISFDTLGAKYMSGYGYDKPTTPNIDRFAEEGVLFEQHFSVSRSTLPSHMSILTSVYPTVHKVIDSYASVLDNRFVTLAEVLQQVGYETGAFVDGNRKLNIGAAHGFDQGFDFYEHLPERFLPHEKLYVIKRVINFVANFLHSRGIPDVHSDNVFNGALAWLSRRDAGRPFFLFLHTYDIHSDFNTKLPYVAPQAFRHLEYKEYSGKFDGCDPEGYKCATEYLGLVNKRICRGTHRPEDLFSAEDAKFIESLYACGIAYTDYEFGRFAERLRQMKLLDNTIVVLTSDHGEEFLQHGQMKHNQYFDEIIKVPLILRFPPKLPAGTRVPHLTRSIDILPTILDLVDVEFASPQFQGVSLVKLLAADGQAPELVLFAGEDRPVDVTARVLRTREYKYISVGGERRAQPFYRDRPEQLYNLVTDPGETQNLVEIEKQVYEKMRQQVKEWKAACEDLRLTLVPKAMTKKLQLDKKTVKELESLGYIK